MVSEQSGLFDLGRIISAGTFDAHPGSGGFDHSPAGHLAFGAMVDGDQVAGADELRAEASLPASMSGGGRFGACPGILAAMMAEGLANWGTVSVHMDFLLASAVVGASRVGSERAVPRDQSIYPGAQHRRLGVSEGRVVSGSRMYSRHRFPGLANPTEQDL